MSLIRLEDVYKIYNPGSNEVRALDGVTMTVDAGEFVAIIGQSGSGKSTMMNIIGCLDMPTRGHYILDDREIGEREDEELSQIRNRQIGFIFQGFNLIPGMSAADNVELPLLYRGMPKEQRKKLSLEALDKVGLIGRKHHRPSQMSGGQQQRAAIARAIAAKPPVILADEPTGNLDSASGAEIMKILHDLSNEGKTIILITHDSQVAQAAGRVVRIHDGRIVSDISGGRRAAGQL